MLDRVVIQNDWPLIANIYGRCLPKHSGPNQYWLSPCCVWTTRMLLLTTSVGGLFQGSLYLYVWIHDDVIKWKHFPRCWPFVRGIHRSPVNSPHKGQWRRALMFSLIYSWINSWVNNYGAGDLRRHLAHYGVTVMLRKVVNSRMYNTIYVVYIVCVV